MRYCMLLMSARHLFEDVLHHVCGFAPSVNFCVFLGFKVKSLCFVKHAVALSDFLFEFLFELLIEMHLSI